MKIILKKSYDKIFNSCLNNYVSDDCNFFMYVNKNNFCSGYFPEFISSFQPGSDAFKQLYSKDNFKNSYPDDIINKSYPNCYPHFKNGKHSKQISNVNSRYNNSYFYKMQPIYKICKKFWKPYPRSDIPSYKHCTDRFSSNHSPCYERVAKGSERRTLGDHQY